MEILPGDYTVIPPGVDLGLIAAPAPRDAAAARSRSWRAAANGRACASPSGCCARSTSAPWAP